MKILKTTFNVFCLCAMLSLYSSSVLAGSEQKVYAPYGYLHYDVQVSQTLKDEGAYLEDISCGAVPVGTGGKRHIYLTKKNFSFKVQRISSGSGKILCSVWVLNHKKNKLLYHHTKHATYKEGANSYTITLKPHKFDLSRTGK